MSLAIKLPKATHQPIDKECFKGNGEEYFKPWQRKHKPENVDETFISRGVGRTAINSFKNSVGFANYIGKDTEE